MTKKYYGEGTGRRLPAALLMAVIFVIACAMALFTTQSAYADDEYDDGDFYDEYTAEFVMVDEDGNELDNQENLPLFKGGKKYIRIDVNGMGDGDSLKEPYLFFYVDGEERQCEKDDGWSYDPNTRILELDGTKLWNKGKELDTSDMMIRCIIQQDGVDEANVGDCTVELAEETVKVERGLSDEEFFVGESTVYYSDGYEVEEKNSTYPEGMIFEAALTDVVIESSEPREGGEDVVSINKENDRITIEAVSEGTAVIKATFNYDNDKEISEEYTIKVVDNKYEVAVTTIEKTTEALPGESLNLKATVTRETAEGSEELDDVEYKWSILGEDDEEGVISRFFTITPDPSNKDMAKVTFKSKSEIIAAFDKAGDEYDLSDLFEKRAFAWVRIMKNGEEVARDNILIEMADFFYQIGEPEKDEFQFATVKQNVTIDLTLWRIYSSDSGERIKEKVPIRDVEYLYNDEFNDSLMEFDWTKGNSWGTLRSLEEDDGAALIEAYIKDTDYPDDRRYAASKVFTLNYVPRDLSMYEISTRKDYYPITEEDGKVSLKDIGLYVYRDGSILDPNVYDVKFERMYYDPKTDKDKYVTTKAPFGVHKDDMEDAESIYYISIYPKDGSGFRGKLYRESWIYVWYKYKLTGNLNTLLKINQKEIPEYKIGEYCPPGYNDIWFFYNHQRFEAGIKESPILELRDGSRLKRDADYQLKYYKRYPGVSDPENRLTDEDLLTSFPTETGTYLAVAEGKAPYTGKAYLAFDLTESLNGSTVTGITTKTYTGRGSIQDMNKINVTLNGKKLVYGKDFQVTYDDNLKAGKNTAKMYISGINKYSGVVIKAFTINKAKNTLTASGKKVTLKAKKLKKKNQTIKKAKAYKITQNAGKVTFKKVGLNKKKFNKKFTVNAKTGNITIKKGVKKGTYKLKVKVTAAGNTNYNSLAKTVTVTVRVK